MERQAANVLIQNNSFYGWIGIWLINAMMQKVLKPDRREPRCALTRPWQWHSSIQHAPCRYRGNEVWHTRDGIYIDTSQHNILRNNRLHDLRYGVHYMYPTHNTVEGNHTYNTRTGYALMQSNT